MPYVARHLGKVNDKGELVLSNPVEWRAAVSRHKGREVYVTVRRTQQMHSPSARKYYHGVVVEMIAAHIGEDHDDTHDLLKDRSPILKAREIELLDGGHLTMPKRTRDLPSDVYAAYVDECVRWAASFLGLYIPPANAMEVTL